MDWWCLGTFTSKPSGEGPDVELDGGGECQAGRVLLGGGDAAAAEWRRGVGRDDADVGY
jgi:hypothetical protein